MQIYDLMKDVVFPPDAMCLWLLSEEGHVTPTCHHRFIKWLCTIQMKNKIRNTEMEYIARANRCVDSSFPVDAGTADWLEHWCFNCACLLFYFFCTSGITFLHVDMVQSPWWMLLMSLWGVFFFLSKRTKEVYDFIWLGNIYLYMYIKIN